MVDNQTVKNIATLTAEVAHLKEALEHNENACKVRDDEAMKRIKALEDYKTKTERYGFFLMGMVAVGTMIASGIDKITTKIMALIQ